MAWPQVSDYESCALKYENIKKSVNKSCRDDKFIDKSIFYHTIQQLHICIACDMINATIVI